MRGTLGGRCILKTVGVMYVDGRAKSPPTANLAMGIRSLMIKLYTMGYQKWQPAARARRIQEHLLVAGVSRVIDIRINPSSSDLSPSSNYGPREWHLRTAGTGIVSLLRDPGNGIDVDYSWVAELGNPQKQDKEMLILRAHLQDQNSGWPVHRGLDLLEAFIQGGDVCCLLCACKEYEKCHRQIIANAMAQRINGLVISNL